MALELISLEEMNARIKEEPCVEGNTLTRNVGVCLEEIEKGCCRAYVDMREELLNPMGMAHGGTLYTLMDVTAGYAAIYAKDTPQLMVTQCSDVHFLRAITEGRASAEAKVLKAGRKTTLVAVEVKNDAGTLCAYGSFELFYT